MTKKYGYFFDIKNNLQSFFELFLVRNFKFLKEKKFFVKIKGNIM